MPGRVLGSPLATRKVDLQARSMLGDLNSGGGVFAEGRDTVEFRSALCGAWGLRHWAGKLQASG